MTTAKDKRKKGGQKQMLKGKVLHNVMPCKLKEKVQLSKQETKQYISFLISLRL
jgi:hypothetical protein